MRLFQSMLVLSIIFAVLRFKMTIDSSDVKKIAQLARLKLKPEEEQAFIKELNHILGWVAQLEEVNTTNIEPMFSVNVEKMHSRRDEVTEGNYPEAIIANAPESEFNMFTVPKVVE